MTVLITLAGIAIIVTAVLCTDIETIRGSNQRGGRR